MFFDILSFRKVSFSTFYRFEKKVFRAIFVFRESYVLNHFVSRNLRLNVRSFC